MFKAVLTMTYVNGFQIVTSVNYMLSDLYIPVNTNPISPKLEDLTNMGEDSLTNHVDSDDDSSCGFDDEKPTYSVDIHDLCLSHKKEKKSKSKLIIIHFIGILNLF